MGGGHRKDTEDQHAGDQHLLAADTVGTPAANEGARQEAKDAGAEHQAHLPWLEAEGLGHGRGGDAHGLEVHALQQGDDEAQHEGQAGP